MRKQTMNKQMNN